MGHRRHYTLEEANASLDWVRDRIARLRGAREQLTDEEARKALSDATPGNGGGAPGQVVSEGFLALREALTELQEAEIVLRDLDRGLVDFPAVREGEEVYFCWVEDEDQIGWWHPPDTGYAGRQPL